MTAELDAAIRAAGVKAALGTKLFPPALWHQSVSDRYADRPELRERLLAAGGDVRVPGFSIDLDQLRKGRNPRGNFNVEARQRSACSELVTLVDAINEAVAAHGLPKGDGHSPHVTLSYGFNGELPGTQPMTPVEWRVDAFELVVGGGQPYGYTTLGRWTLGPPAARASQPSLF
ncbi:2'-5' RNA ligase family protein [Luteimonas dalianensis]|uniref:2'-5' RNA ligase family protein n=1 Tax=Luteimonas dalianensis TaxID=1148196 RepID=UPI003BF042F2